MNGMGEKKMVVAEPSVSYSAAPDPYKDAPSMHLDLPNLSRYADSVGKKIMDLTAEEIEKFRI